MSYRKPFQRLGFPILTAAALAVSCSKETRGNESVLSIATPAGSGADQSPGGAGGASSEQLRQEARQADEFLKNQISDEAKQRLAADAQLADDIKALNRRIEELSGKLDAEVKRLDAEDKRLGEEVAGLKGKLATDIAALQADLAKTKAELDAQIRDKIAGLEAKMKTADAILQAQLLLAIADLNIKLKLSESQLKAQITSQIAVLRTDFESYKKYADQNFATKTELQAANMAIQSLKDMAAVMNSKIDANDAAINARLTNELKAERDAMLVAVAAVQADVDSVRNALNRHILQYRQTVQRLADFAVAEAIEVRRLLNQYRLETGSDISKLRSALTSLTNRTTELEVYAQDTRKALGDKILELQARDAELAQDVRDASLSAAQNLSVAIAEEQGKREALKRELDSLAAELQRVNDVASQALAIAQANQHAIGGLRSDLDAAKKDFAQQISDLRGEVNAKIEDVKNAAQDLVRNLSVQVQEQFVRVAVQIGELRQRDVAIVTEVLRYLSKVNVNITVIGDLQNSQAYWQGSDALAYATGNLVGAIERAENAFVDALDPVLQSKNVNLKELDAAFRPIAAQCKGETNPYPSFAAVNNREWLFHVARMYVGQLIAGARTGNPDIDRIFQGEAPMVDGLSLASAIALSGTQPYAAGTEGNCMQLVSNWVNGTLFGSSANAVALRRAVSESAALRAAVADLKVRVAGLSQPALALEGMFIQILRPVLGSDANILAFLTKGGNFGPAFRSILAQAQIERAAIRRESEEQRINREKFVDLARQIATVRGEVASVNARVSALDNKIDALAQATQNRLNQLTGQLKTSFNLIAAIAARLGYDDLVQIAVANINQLGGPVITDWMDDPSKPTTCFASQHFYNHSYGNNLFRCEGTLSTGAVPTSSAVCYVRHLPNQWDTYSFGHSWEAGQYVPPGQGALIPALDATNPEALRLSKLTLAQTKAENKTMLSLRVFGNAKKFRIQSTNGHDVIVNAADFKVGNQGDRVIYEIPIPKATGPATGCTSERTITVTALDAAGVARGQQCKHIYRTYYSPLVLDLSGTGLADLVNPLASKVKFDLDANGVAENPGWIGAQAGLLAIDLNGNGAIDDGKELFGEASRLAGGAKAANGYAALAQYDVGRKGFLDASDPTFAKLRVWADRNQDGVSQSYELLPLARLGITRIGTSYEDVAPELVHQNQGMEEKNIVKYEARYWGPSKCGTQGCKTYDVYFGRTEDRNYKVSLEDAVRLGRK